MPRPASFRVDEARLQRHIDNCAAGKGQSSDAEDIAEALRAARADLSRLADAARAVLVVEWDMVDPQHHVFAMLYPDLLAAIRALGEVMERMEREG